MQNAVKVQLDRTSKGKTWLLRVIWQDYATGFGFLSVSFGGYRAKKQNISISEP